MVIPYLGGVDLPIDNMTTNTEIEDYIETWCKDRNNWVKDESVSVSPLMDGLILFGCKFTNDDWRNYYNQLGL